MFFTVSRRGSRLPATARSNAFLVTDNWNDFGYTTLYYLHFVDDEGEYHSIGGVKIGQFDMAVDQSHSAISQAFDRLDDRFFSLGQDDSYYEFLNKLDEGIRDQILAGLRDVARDLDLFDRALAEKVTGVSLLRTVSRSTVRGQYSRLAQGGARLSRYEFSYTAPNSGRGQVQPISLKFEVEPESQPPTNIHVLIGRNGVGKTYLLEHMARALVKENSPSIEVGEFASEHDQHDPGAQLFANLVSVTFSAFDSFEPLPDRQDKATGVHYAYIGLKLKGKSADGKPLAPKSLPRLALEFTTSVQVCRQGARANRWKRAIQMLEADPIFRDAEVAELADEVDDGKFKKRASSTFSNLSSGHKIVLLTITRLVETVEERTLVLLDEPEAHLHPPLLSAFVRALSDLLINRNGVAIIATHSPVVLQEVPKSCAWKIRRMGQEFAFERPEIETFGENVGILTREVFGLEVTHSGFHKLLHDSIGDDTDFGDVLRHFNEELGGEAKAIVRALIANRLADDDI